MIRNVLVRAVLAASLVAIPAAATAQDEPGTPLEPSGPEGVPWGLTAYDVDGELVAVPWEVEASLQLDAGQASGSNGCNRFNGGYTLVGESLTFDEAFSMTAMACFGDHADVEMGYMANLPQVASWTVVEGVLQLSDAESMVLLEYAEPIVGFTAGDLAEIAALMEAQQAEIDRLTKRLDNVRVGTLRDRIKELEAEVKQLRSQGSSGSSGSAFTAAEKVLLEAIPAGIKSTCTPRRSQNPSGTVAAVQCKPSASGVGDMAYYLMEAGKAGAAWEQRMDQYNVKDGPGSCRKGKKDKVYYTPGPDSDGCYVNQNGRANLRYVIGATSCRQLNAGGTQLKHPALYVAVLGDGNDLATLTKWAEPKTFGGPTNLYKTIKRPNEAWDTSCPT